MTKIDIKEVGLANDEIAMDSVIRCSDVIVASDIDGEVVMMSIEKGEYYGLDMIGSDIERERGRRLTYVSNLETPREKGDIHKFISLKEFESNMVGQNEACGEGDVFPPPKTSFFIYHF